MGLHSLEVWVEVGRQGLQNPDPVYKLQDKNCSKIATLFRHETLLYDPVCGEGTRDASLRTFA